MKTVVHLLPNYNPFPPIYPAGTELRVAEASLRQKRYKPIIICGGFPGQPAREAIGITTVERIHIGRVYRRIFQKITRLDPWSYGKRMWRKISLIRPDVIHIHNEPKILAMLAPYLHKNKIPTIVHIANDKPIQSELLPLVTHWISCSNYMASWLHKHTGVEKRDISVIYTGVDTANRRPKWEVPDSEILLKRKKWKITESDFVYLFAGRIVKEKGVNELLDAFEKINIDKPIKLLIAGNVRDSTDPTNEKAVYGREITARIKTMKNVEWVGSLHPEKMHDFLLSGDVFILPSLWNDPFPTVMLEAATAGLPIITARRGGITEFMEGCPNIDLLGDAGNSDKLASAMISLTKSSSLRENSGRCLRDKIDNNFDWERVAIDFENLYDSITEQ